MEQLFDTAFGARATVGCPPPGGVRRGLGESVVFGGEVGGGEGHVAGGANLRGGRADGEI